MSNDIQNVLSVFKTSSDDLEYPSTPNREEYISLAFFPFNFSMFSLSVRRHRALTKHLSDLFSYQIQSLSDITSTSISIVFRKPIYRDYFMVGECVRFLFTSCEGSLNEGVSAANE